MGFVELKPVNCLFVDWSFFALRREAPVVMNAAPFVILDECVLPRYAGCSGHTVHESLQFCILLYLDRPSNSHSRTNTTFIIPNHLSRPSAHTKLKNILMSFLLGKDCGVTIKVTSVEHIKPWPNRKTIMLAHNRWKFIRSK